MNSPSSGPDDQIPPFTPRSDIKSMNRRMFFARGGESYSFDDMITMLRVDAENRELTPTFNELDMRKWLWNMPDNTEFRIRGHEGETRFVCQKNYNNNFTIKMVLGVYTPLNNRMMCSDADSAYGQFGSGFMGLGGNSYSRPK